jgi:hypothetical protein
MNYRHYVATFAFLISSPVLLMAMPDFGVTGLKGLDAGKIKQLEQGHIVFTVSESSDDKSRFIEAAFLLDEQPAEVWELLYRTEDHYLYLSETESSRALQKSQTRDLIEYRVKVLMIGTTFRLIHQYDWKALYMHWDLDPDFDNGLKEFRGFWRLYSYEGGRTLARYGNKVSLAGIPDFIVDLFRKGGIVRALEAVRLYVESDGAFRK